MAFAVASKGAPLAGGLLKNLRLAAPSSSLLGPASAAATRRRVYSTGGGAPFHRDYYYYEPALFFHPMFLYHHQLLARHLFFHPMFFTPAAPARAWWVSKQDENAVVAMPGLPAERVKVWTNQKGLFVKGEGESVKGPDDVVVQDQDPAPYSCHIELSADAFDLDKAQAKMKDGLLKVTVPWVKGTEIKVE